MKIDPTWTVSRRERKGNAILVSGDVLNTPGHVLLLHPGDQVLHSRKVLHCRPVICFVSGEDSRPSLRDKDTDTSSEIDSDIKRIGVKDRSV